MPAQSHESHGHYSPDLNRPTFLITPPILSKKEIGKEQVAAEHGFDNFDGIGVASTGYTPSISSQNIQEEQERDQKTGTLSVRPESAALTTPTSSHFPSQFPTSPSQSATVAALASASARMPLKIKSVRMVESSSSTSMQNLATPMDSEPSFSPSESFPIQYQHVVPVTAMRGEEGFSGEYGHSAAQGNIDDEEEEDRYEDEEAAEKETYEAEAYQHDSKDAHPYKVHILNVHTPPLLDSTTSFDANGHGLIKKVNDDPISHADTLDNGFDNLSLEPSQDQSQPGLRHFQQFLESENNSQAPLPYSNDKYKSVNIPSYYYNDNQFETTDPTQLQDLEARTTTHPTIRARPLDPLVAAKAEHEYPTAGSGPHSHSESLASSYSVGLDAEDENDPENLLGHHNHSSVASVASSGILDSAGGISKVNESEMSNKSREHLHDATSVYSELSNATVRMGPDGLPSALPILSPTTALPRAVVHNANIPTLSGGYEAPLNTNEVGQRMVSRTNELLLKRQQSGEFQKTGAATVNVTDSFKNDHITAPVVYDQVTGEPLVFYPAAIPVALKLPPLLSKRNQAKAQAAAEAGKTNQQQKKTRKAQQNRPKTFIIPPPPVWTIDPSIVPDDLQEKRRSSVGSSSVLLNRRQSMGGMSVMTDVPTTVKIKRRRSSAGTLSVLNMVGNDLEQPSPNLNQNQNQHQRNVSVGTFESGPELLAEDIGQNSDKDKELKSGESNNDGDVLKVHKKQRSMDRKTHARKASAVSKMSYIDGDDAWDDGEEEEEEDVYSEVGDREDNIEDEDVGNESELIDTGHFLNDEIDSDCATVPSGDEYQEEFLDSDEEDNENNDPSAIGNDRNVDDFAFTSFNPNAPVTDRGLLGGSISYSSGIFPSVGVQPQTLIEELEQRKAERKARVQRVYYDTVTGNAIAADMYGRKEPTAEQLIRLESSGHPLDDRHNKSLLELQDIAIMNYKEELQARRNIQNAHEIERQMQRYGGVNGSKAVLSQLGLLNTSNGSGYNPADGLNEVLDDVPGETLKERRARLKKQKKEQERAAAELSELHKISVEGEGGLPDDEEEPPGETLAERRARLKKKKKMLKEKNIESGNNGGVVVGKENTVGLVADLGQVAVN